MTRQQQINQDLASIYEGGQELTVMTGGEDGSTTYSGENL